MTILIERFDKAQASQVVELSLRAWAPVFSKMERAVPGYVFNAFYPRGWQARQIAEIEALLADEAEMIWVARDRERIIGWVGIRIHPRDSMGEIYILAVDPARQREGVASQLMETAFAHMRDAGMKMVMVETGGDPGHEPSRATYEKVGFERWPVARYFREL